MKLGAENKNKVIFMVVLLAILLGIAIYDVFSGPGGTSAAPPASSTSTAASSTTAKIQGKKATEQAAQSNLDPTVHLDVLEASRRVKYEPGRNIFRMEEVVIPPPVKNPRTEATPPPTPTPTPPPPQIPLKFYGFQNRSATDKQIFLAENDVVFVAKQGDIIDRRYRVVSIQKTSVTIEDVLTNNKQDIPLRNQQ